MKAFKYRCYPTDDQKLLLERTFGCCRFVWNQCLAKAKTDYEYWLANPETEKPSVNGYYFVKQIPLLKLDNPFLNEVSSVALQQALLNLGEAFQGLFKGKGYPQFKSKHRNRKSFGLVGSALKLRGNKLNIAKLKEPLKVEWRKRYLPSEPINCTLSQTPDGKYWISFLCKEYDPQLTNGQGRVGIDLGLKDLVVDSNGVKYPNPKHLVNAQKRLAKAQRKLARRVKGSARRTKARLAVARIYAKIANQRKDYIHKITRQLVNENQVIGIEGLLVSGMTRNRCLSKAISDAGWGMFKDFITYKARESQHTVVVVLDRWEASTRHCSHCGQKRTEKLTLDQRSWTCEHCGTLHDRDTNAAMNCKRVAEHLYAQTQPLGGSVLFGYSVLETLVYAPAAPGSAQSTTVH